MGIDSPQSPPTLVSAARTYWVHIRPQSRPMLLAMLVSIVQPIMMLPIAFLVQQVFDTYIPQGNYQALITTGIGLSGLYFLNSAITIGTRYLSLNSTKRMITSFREALLAKLLHLPRAFYDRADRAALHTTMVQDTERLDVATNALLAYTIPGLFISLVLCAILIGLNGLLFLIVLAAFAAVGLASRLLGGKTRQEARAYHSAFQSFSSGILFVLQTLDLIHLQSAQSLEQAQQRRRFDALRIYSGRMAWLNGIFRLSQDVIFTAFISLILAAGGMNVAAGVMSLGDLLAFYAVLLLLRPQLQTFFSSVPALIEGTEALLRLHTLMHAADAPPYQGNEQIAFSGAIRLQDVSFHYHDKPVLRNISLSLQPACTYALVGLNGSGKTTLINLILGFYRPQSGQLLADDVPYDRLNIDHLRAAMGVVPQNPVIFAGTILENIRYGVPEASDEQIVEAARLATADAFIRQMPAGYATLVGENGAMLSGGQRQRLVIARALLRQPRLLILDEPTNHLDRDSVQQVMQNIQALAYRPTILIVSHDQQAITGVDDAYVLHEGRLVAAGDLSDVSDTLSTLLGTVEEGMHSA